MTKKKFKIRNVLIVALIIGIVAILMWKATTPQYSSKLDGEERVVVWEVVNVRDSPSTSSEVLYQLEAGDTVQLTGYSATGGPYDGWVETTGGWIVIDAVRPV